MISLKKVAFSIGLEAPDIELRELVCDSRKVGPETLFLALKGQNFDARTKIEEACLKGASAIFYEDTPDFKLPQNLSNYTHTYVAAVPNLSSKLAELAATFYEEPSKSLDLIGVTGTNGKSTVTHLVAQWGGLLGLKTGVMGTLGNGFYPHLAPSPNTTMQAPALEKELRTMLDLGAKAVAMEVSSHGIAEGRVRGLKFSNVAFTNLSRDHLDYHKTMENYAQTKFQLLTWVASDKAVINIDDKVGLSFYQKMPHALAYSRKPQVLPRVIYAKSVRFHERGFTLEVDGTYGNELFEFSLIGGFNVENALCAIGLMLNLGFKLKDLANFSAQLKPVGGRMECYGGSSSPLIIVDYAHTPDGLEKALKAVKEHNFGRVICICGCGGDRDTGKRAEMGSIACSHADHVIFTDDNPRTEDPKKIIDMMIDGARSFTNYEVIQPREMAVRKAVEQAKMGDVVLLAGKGHENYQIIGTTKYHYSDCEMAKLLSGEQR